MRRQLITLLIPILWTGTVIAEPITVRSGEHESFSRLVIQTNVDRNWSVETDSNQSRIIFEPALPELDLGSIFDRIPRSRIAEVTYQDGLILMLNCACDIDVSRHDGRYLVIDVRDATATATARPQQILTPTNGIVPLGLFDLAELLIEPSASEPHMAQNTISQDPSLQAAMGLMAEQLSRATAAGLLDTQPQMLLRQNSGTEAEPPSVTVDPMPQSAPLQINTAYDQLRSGQSEQSETQALSCRSLQTENISDWTGRGSFDARLGSLRIAVFDPLDRVNNAVAIELSEFYLSYGFGAEARYWLMSVMNPPPFQTALADFLSGQSDVDWPAPDLCHDTLRLWLYLDGQTDLAHEPDAAAQVEQQFARLPHHLKDLVGPQLARQLHADGQDAIAAEIVDSLARSGRLDETNLAILQQETETSFRTVDPDEEIVVLRAALSGTSNRRIENMTALLRLEIGGGSGVSSDDIILADALIREFDPEPILGGLVHQTLLAHAAYGDIAQSIEYLRRVSERDVILGQTVLMSVLGSLERLEKDAARLALSLAFSVPGNQTTEDPYPTLDSIIVGRGQDADPAQLGMAQSTALETAQTWLNRDFERLSEQSDNPISPIAARYLSDQLDPSMQSSTEANDLGQQVDDSREWIALLRELLVPPRDISGG